MSVSSSSSMDRRGRFIGRRRVAGAVLGCLMLFDVGCYTYQPIVDAQPAPGQHLSLELTDAGRAALADQLGSGVLTVDGTLQDIQGGQYVLGVSSITTIRGGTAHWGGERVKIPTTDVAHMGTRTLSRSRTALVIGAVLAGIGALIVTRNLIGGGFQPSTDSSRVIIGGT